MPALPVDQMKPFRDEATLRAEIFLPVTFTTLDIGTSPRRLFSGRFGVSGLIVQALSSNTGTIFYGNEPTIVPGYGFALAPGASTSWFVTLPDILQVLGWEGAGNIMTRERRPEQWQPFRQTRVLIDAAQFWFVADAADQHISIQISTVPRY